MTEQQIEFVRQCIKDDDMHRFYNSYSWKRKRQQVLAIDRYECQICRQNKLYTEATTVHHMNFVRKHPELALEIWYEWRGEKKRNLISLCHDCHERIHGHRKKNIAEPLTEERWD